MNCRHGFISCKQKLVYYFIHFIPLTKNIAQHCLDLFKGAFDPELLHDPPLALFAMLFRDFCQSNKDPFYVFI